MQVKLPALPNRVDGEENVGCGVAWPDEMEEEERGNMIGQSPSRQK